jgi:hypothetical protein
VSVSCVCGFSLFVAYLLSAPIPDPVADAVESSMGVLGLGSLGVGAGIGMRTTGLSGWRTWLAITVGAFCCLLPLIAVSDVLIAWFDERLAGDLPFYAVLAVTVGWLLWRRGGRPSRLVSAIVVSAIVAVALLLAVDERSSDWLFVGIPAALITALLIAWGLSVLRRDPDRRWPVIAVGLVAGLVAGLAMLQAAWAEARWPHRRRLIDTLAITVGAGVAFVAVYAAFGPWLSLGPAIGSGRIERPEHGFAITFPGDWTAQEATAEGVATFWGETEIPEGQAIVLGAERSLQGGACTMTLDDPSVRQEPMLLAQSAASTERDLAEGEDGDEVVRTRVDLPVGPAWRIDSSVGDLSDSAYLLRGPRGIYMLECWSDEPPEDRWRSIAQTVEFLPDPASGSSPSSPVLGGGRIERPAEGFALTFPTDWTVEEVTPETNAALFSDVGPQAQAFRTIDLWADQPESEGYCLIVDFTRLADEPPPWTTIQAATVGWWDVWKDDPTVVDPDFTFADLPAGRIGHLTATDLEGAAHDAYVFTDSEAWFLLECWSPDPPEDRWLSIAETFEFLPVEE